MSGQHKHQQVTTKVGLMSLLAILMVFIILVSQYGVDCIINGEQANVGELPFMVSIQQRDREEKPIHLCGGSLIDNQHILTAAHCVSEMAQGSLVAKVGCHKLSECKNEHNIKSYLVHKLHNKIPDPNFKLYDVAILKLESPIDLNATESVAAIPLATRDKYSGPDDGQWIDARVSTAGWGWTEHVKEHSDILMKVGLLPKSRRYCDLMFEHMSDLLICAVSEAKLPCIGDDGGPLFLTETDTSGKQTHTLVGVLTTSKGFCVDGGVFHRVAPLVSWIQASVEPDAPVWSGSKP